MPPMTYEPKATNDKSTLTNGWHPAYLLSITDEPTPPGWKMHEKSPRMWRWTFAVWERPEQITQCAPERQSVPSSQTFTPARGNNQASKSYSWTAELLRRTIQAGELIDLDPLLPLACRVKVSRNGEYANIIDLERWDAPPLTPVLKDTLIVTGRRDGSAPPVTPPSASMPPGMSAYQPQTHPIGFPAPSTPGIPPGSAGATRRF